MVARYSQTYSPHRSASYPLRMARISSSASCQRVWAARFTSMYVGVSWHSALTVEAKERALTTLLAASTR
jgi:hypothetical protein